MTPQTVHHVTQQTDRAYRRWVCSGCDWATEWTFYTRQGDAIAAVRHQIEHHREGTL